MLVRLKYMKKIWPHRDVNLKRGEMISYLVQIIVDIL